MGDGKKMARKKPNFGAENQKFPVPGSTPGKEPVPSYEKERGNLSKFKSNRRANLPKLQAVKRE